MTKLEAIRKAMDYLGARDHSRRELKKKLQRFEVSPEDIEAALDHVEESGWLLSPEKLAVKVAEQLHRKKKSYFYILGYLREKGLPTVPRVAEIEQEKAQKLLESRFSDLSKLSHSDKKKRIQYLKNRGFDRETIAKVINDPSGTSEGF